MNTTETDEMTFFERNGIRYEQRGDFLYPVLALMYCYYYLY